MEETESNVLILYGKVVENTALGKYVAAFPQSQALAINIGVNSFIHAVLWEGVS